MVPFLLAVSPLVGWYMGRWLDDRLGTAPVLSLIFLGLGFAAGVRETVRVIRRASAEAAEDDRVETDA